VRTHRRPRGWTGFTLYSSLLTPDDSRRESKSPAAFGRALEESGGLVQLKGRIKTIGIYGWPEKVGLIEVGLKVVSFPKPLPFSIDAPS
jgi:hypothetical protein